MESGFRRVELSPEACDRLWSAWTPSDVAVRLAAVAAPWCVVAGWALDLYTGGTARSHDDLEIAVPSGRFSEIAAALPGYEWHLVGDSDHQTWLYDKSLYRLDVFREPHAGDTWICRRDNTIRLPYAELIIARNGIPIVIPEVALLFKAKAVRPKDEADFTRVLPALDDARRERLRDWLTRVHPGHRWLTRL